MNSTNRRTTLRDLIHAGILQPPFNIVHQYQGQLLSGQIGANGEVRVGSDTYTTLSAAAVAAIKSTRATRQGAAMNGWQFWKYRDESGTLRPMSDLRSKLGLADRQGEPRR